MPKKISKPKISLLVVINGPVAKAGSILYRFNMIGTNVPIKDAMIITEIKANEMVNATK